MDRSGSLPRPRPALQLEALADAARMLDGVRRGDLAPGDRLLVSTRNSIYTLTARAQGDFLVSGGWYERQGAGEVAVAVAGCTAGGRALFTEMVAAPGLFLEFGDGTATTRIRRVRRLAPTTGASAAPDCEPAR